jgi:hypothetical protein
VKRTTLVLEDGCMEAVRQLAHKEGRTLSSVVNELLAEGAQRRRRAPRRSTLKLPTYSMGRPRVDLGDRDALETAMEAR